MAKSNLVIVESPAKAKTIGKYLGPGYAKHSPETWLALRLLARTEGIFLDTTYNAKVFAGLTDLCQKGHLPTDEAVVIFHTGGVPTLLMREE